ncbi:MAG: hypothetical protein KatS3mg119_0658 [Rhodothalassiaceae bacterium]|nr:MAG: hypothetical protein KatS3mg119_0658 [Rhodothalassiaceae bacterium]
MSYYFATVLDATMEDAIARVTAALTERGFGVLTRIDVDKTLKKKIGADFRPYVILGACNPRYAHQALQVEDKIGTMLPCNVIVQEIAPGRVEVAAVDPVASMAAIDNPKLAGIAGEVRDLLKRTIDSLAAAPAEAGA